MNEVISREEIEQGDKQSAASYNLGKRLKERRERKGLTISEVAGRLRVSSEVISKIESNGYLPEDMTLYVRGNMRNYAKLVDVSLEEVEQTFLQLGVHVEAIKAEPIRFKARPYRKRRRIVRLMTYFIVIMLVILVFAWRHAYRVADNNVVATPPVAQNMVVVSPKTVTNQNVGVVQQ